MKRLWLVFTLISFFLVAVSESGAGQCSALDILCWRGAGAGPGTGKAGNDFPLVIRISGDERTPGGRDIPDSQAIAPKLVEAGVNAFHVSGGVIDRDCVQIIAGSDYPDGLNVPAAVAIKQVVDIPVMVVGRIHDPQFAEHILQKNQADLIVMGRPLLADPELPNKAREGKLSDIRRCISCHHCFDSDVDTGSIACAVNAATGNEGLYRFDRAQRPKKVVVVGGGPAGMEAARVADLRGHQVVLYERQPRLGGSLKFACTVHSENDDFLKYLIGQVKKSTIDVRLGQEFTPQLLQQTSPDVVIVAMGPNLEVPSIPGSDRRNVFSGPQLKQLLTGLTKDDSARTLLAWQRLGLSLVRPFMQRFLNPSFIRRATKVWMPVGKKVVVIGADLAGCELALFLAGRGRRVTVVDTGEVIAPEVGRKRKGELTSHLERAGVAVLLKAKCDEITSEGVVVLDKTGERQVIKADTVILAGEARPNAEASKWLDGKVAEIYTIGDCSEVGLIKKATADAMRIACRI